MKQAELIRFRPLEPKELRRELFHNFIRRQTVTRCWRKIDGVWCIKDAPFVDDWTGDDYRKLTEELRATVMSGGLVYGAFNETGLKGFVAVDKTPMGSLGQYLDLVHIYTSQDKKGCGIGRRLFERAADWARDHGAKKLYISAHSAVESQAFYEAMGCVEAEEYDSAHVEKEPFDCQLEYRL